MLLNRLLSCSAGSRASPLANTSLSTSLCLCSAPHCCQSSAAFTTMPLCTKTQGALCTGWLLWFWLSWPLVTKRE